MATPREHNVASSDADVAPSSSSSSSSAQGDCAKRAAAPSPSLSRLFRDIGLSDSRSRKRRRTDQQHHHHSSASEFFASASADGTASPSSSADEQTQPHVLVHVVVPGILATPDTHRAPSTPPPAPRKPSARPAIQREPTTPSKFDPPGATARRALSFADAVEEEEEEEEEAPDNAAAQPPRASIGYSLLKDAVTSGAFSARSDEYAKYSRLRGSIICIEGIISAGKTTLGTNMAKYLNDIGVRAEFFQEFVEETLLRLFYSDPKKYAFSFQLFMLRCCIANIDRAEQKARSDGTVCIIDRSTWGNAVFAAMQYLLGNISEEEWAVYLRILKSRESCADHVVYLDCNPASSLERIKDRGRQSESSVPLEYLANLERHYTTEMLLHMREGTANIVPLQWDRFGSVPSVLDALVGGTRYRVQGDVAAVYDRDRAYRARVMSRLSRDGFVDLDQIP